MARIITCADGVVIRGETDATLIAAAEAHMRLAHTELAGRLSPDEILAMSKTDASADVLDEEGR